MNATPQQDEHPSSQQTAWWQAAGLSERCHGLSASQARALSTTPVPLIYNDATATANQQEWLRTTGLNVADSLYQRLNGEGIDHHRFLFCLGETPDHFYTRMGCRPPPWQAEIEAIYRQPYSLALPLNFSGATQTARDFLEVVRPLINSAYLLLNNSLGEIKEIIAADRQTLLLAAISALCRNFHAMLQSTVVQELHLQRGQNPTADTSAEQRYADFVARFRHAENSLHLLRNYPVLARLLLLRRQQWHEAFIEFTQRLYNDKPIIAQHLLVPDHHDHRADSQAISPAANDIGLIKHLEIGRGDRHAHGRSVIIVHFDTGASVVYKPKPLAVDAAFQHFIAWLNRAGCSPSLPTMKVIDRGQYGWCEYLTHHACADESAVRRFYRRQGVYLAVLYALQATDFHCENVIASGEYPYLVDLETLLQPHLRDNLAVGRGMRIQAASVIRCGLLPEFYPGVAGQPNVDLGGISYDEQHFKTVITIDRAGRDDLKRVRQQLTAGPRANQPLLDGRAVAGAAYQQDILSGFSSTYRLLCARRDDLLAADSPLNRFGGHRIRHIFRPTDLYARLLLASFQPDYLDNGLLRDRLFDKLWLDYRYYPSIRGLIHDEAQALKRGDIPLFTTRADSTDLITDNGRRMTDFFPRSGLQQCRERIAAMNSRDLARQYEIARSCLCAPTPPTASQQPLPAISPKNTELRINRRLLVDTARTIARQLDDQAIHYNGYMGWLGPAVQQDGRCNIEQLAVNLYDGLGGLALFHAALFRVTGDPAYHATVLRIWHTLTSRVRDNPKALTSLGAYTGWGGLWYCAARLARDGLISVSGEQRALWLEQTANALKPGCDYDLLAGCAGAIMGLLRWHQYHDDQAAVQLAHRCGQFLVAGAKATTHNRTTALGWLSPARQGTALTGFSHGAAGIAVALVHLSRAVAEPQERQHYVDTAYGALQFERAHYCQQQQNWPDLRRQATHQSSGGMAGDDDSGQPAAMIAWCHGAAGIGLSRLLLQDYLPDPRLHDDLCNAVQRTMDGPWGKNQSLCHGDLGNLELIHSAGLRLRQPHWLRFCRRQLQATLPLLRNNRMRYGIKTEAFTPGLMNGKAGMGYALLRMAYPRQVPSVLMLE